MNTISFACGLLATGVAAAASAQQAATPGNPADPDLGQRMAASYASMSSEYFEDLLAPEPMYRLFLLTKQEVVSVACDGFALDEDRLSAALNEILRTQPMNDGRPNALINGRVMHGYGIVKGGERALATYDPDAYCAYGRDIIKELSVDPRGEALLVLSVTE